MTNEVIVYRNGSKMTLTELKAMKKSKKMNAEIVELFAIHLEARKLMKSGHFEIRERNSVAFTDFDGEEIVFDDDEVSLTKVKKYRDAVKKGVLSKERAKEAFESFTEKDFYSMPTSAYSNFRRYEEAMKNDPNFSNEKYRSSIGA